MQTVLESLEQAYINNLNILHEAERNNDTYTIEEAVCVQSELTKAIVLIVLNNLVCPFDKRVYTEIALNNNTFATTDEETKTAFLQVLYDNGILDREYTYTFIAYEDQTIDKEEFTLYGISKERLQDETERAIREGKAFKVVAFEKELQNV